MDANFWHKKWQTNNIGFHGSKPNPLLVENFEALSLAQGSRVFVPLCGKTLDIGWLLSQGYAVTGVELSELAIEQLFDELGIEPIISDMGKLKHFSAPNIDIFVGDFFDLTQETLGIADAIFDRAALVALPETMRKKYSQHLTAITHIAPQLLITYEYDQMLSQGSPFALFEQDINLYYAENYHVNGVVRQDVTGMPAKEVVWHLTAKI